MVTYCTRCEKDFGMTGEPYMIDDKRYCGECVEIVLMNKYGEAMGEMIVTTSHNIEGKKIAQYIDIVSSEVIIGTARMTELRAGIADMMGKRASGFEKKLLEAKEDAMTSLKMQACTLGANAIIGVDLDYGVLSSNKMMVVANGTAVKID
jgi:uncharacterized protein YbjQ (UPF0145 family)